jgi:hypothetical protein
MRSNRSVWFIAPLLAVWPLAAGADDNEAAKLISECSIPDLPQSSVDSCLERVRVLEETEPSSQLQSLEGGLEEREAGRMRSARAAPTPPATMQTLPDANWQSAQARDDSAPETANEDRSQPPPSASEVEDEPPIADPPDVPSAGASDEQMNDPGQ